MKHKPRPGLGAVQKAGSARQFHNAVSPGIVAALSMHRAW
jgi:hypothetical protein